MGRKYLLLMLIVLMLYGVNLQILSVQTGTDNSPELKNGRKLKDYISQVIGHSFDLTDAGTKEITTISYHDVAQVKKQGLSRGAKIAIGVGIAAAVTVLTLPGKNFLAVFARSAADRFKFTN